MKKTVTIGVVILLVLGFGYFLFKVSPEVKPTYSESDFDLSSAKPISEPSPLRASDHVFGSRTAKNVFVIYEDFQCPACRAFEPVLRQIPTELKDTVVVVRYFPLLRIHRNTVPSIFAAEAAGEQGRYDAMYALLYEQQGNWSELVDPAEKFAELAQAAGVQDMEKFRSDYGSGKYKALVQEHLVEAASLNLQGTPSVFFNGKPLQTGSLEQIKAQAEPLYRS